MGRTIEDRLNGYGPVLRIVTPVLCMCITLLTTVMLFVLSGIGKNINGVETSVKVLDAHFTNHLMHHQDLEVGYADRLAKIETSRFTDKDGQALEERITKKIPPRWVIDKIKAIDRKLDNLIEKVGKLRR